MAGLFTVSNYNREGAIKLSHDESDEISNMTIASSERLIVDSTESVAISQYPDRSEIVAHDHFARMSQPIMQQPIECRAAKK